MHISLLSQQIRHAHLLQPVNLLKWSNFTYILAYMFIYIQAYNAELEYSLSFHLG